MYYLTKTIEHVKFEENKIIWRCPGKQTKWLKNPPKGLIYESREKNVFMSPKPADNFL